MIRIKGCVGFFFCCISIMANAQVSIYVSPQGNDNGRGTIIAPYQTIQAALKQVATFQQKDISIVLRKGTYYPGSSLLVTPAVLQDHALAIVAYRNEKVVISGATKIHPQWMKWKNGILQATIGKDLTIDQLFCNGRALPMARYPNFDSTQRVFNGTAADAISKERVKKWANPVGGFVHALHQGEWGGFHYRITGVDSNYSLQLEGGWQNNRPSPLHKQHRFVENILEELDAPGEWYYDTKTGILYWYPFAGMNTSNAVFEYSITNELISFKGTEKEPVKNIRIAGIDFTQAGRTFMQTREPLLRSDWTIYRGGAVLIDGAENIKITGCRFYGSGGNAIFISNYDRNILIEGNEIHDVGGNAIAVVGNPEAVRSPAFQYSQAVAWDKIDKQPGPQANTYPSQCIITNNLVHDIGKIEKQVAGVEISMAMRITVSHNTIYNVPRSGINIGDGCWGGHLIAFNDVFNTVLETGDHGAFNSWGRDRFWSPDRKKIDSVVAANPGMPLWDVVEPITMRNNRFHCTHGWDIDLDDGSSNYHIYNNVCLNGGLKLREGYNRVVENNIILNNSFHPHVWLANSGDVFMHNIVSTDYAPIGIKTWGKQVDQNFFLSPGSLLAAQKNGTDLHSLTGDAGFINAAKGNYRVAASSPALQAGFKNFEMDSFGVTSPALKARAAKAPLPDMRMLQLAVKGEKYQWLGATVKNIETLGERSAAGIFDEHGILIISIPAGSLAAKSDLKENDVIRMIDGKPVSNVKELTGAVQLVQWHAQVPATIVRDQKERVINLLLK